VRLLKRFQAEVLANSLAAVRTQPATKPRIDEEAFERGRESNGIPGRNEQARVTVLDRLRHAADRRRDHRQRGGHRLEDREWQPFRGTRQHEDVGAREHVGHVAAVPGEHDRLVQAEPADLRLESRPVGPLADDDGREARPNTAERARERERILGTLQATDGHDRRFGAVAAGGYRPVRVDTVSDHDRSLGVAGAGRESGRALAFGHTDRDRRQRSHHPLRALVQLRGDAGVSRERPPVNGEDPDRHARQRGGESSEHAGFGAVGMEDVRPLAAEEGDELEQTAQIAPRAQWPSDVLERDGARSGSLRRFQQWAGTMRGDDDVELLDECGEQRGHVRLSSASLGERDDDQDPGAALSHCSPRGCHPTTPSAAALRSQQPWPLVAGLIAVALFLVWARVEGGYAPTAWYPGAFVFLVLGAVVLTSRIGSLPRPLLGAVALFGGFTLWSFLSITWADEKGDAWDGANRTLLLFTVYTLFAFLPWRPRDAGLLLGVLATATAAVGSWIFLVGAQSGLSEGRFTDPVGYANANAALFLAAFWPAAVLASRRETPWPARGLFLAVAGLLLQLGVLAQSRGSLPALALALVLYVALMPDRARSLLTLLTIGAATALSLGPLLEVYRADPGEDLQQALAAARTALILTAVFLAAAGVAIGLLDRRRRHVRTGSVRLRRLVVGTLLVIGLATAVTIVSSGPTSRLSDGLASGRYDLWRVAALEFARQPIQGVGADNFAVGYARERHGHEEPLYPHSIELRVLAQTGLVGTALFVGFLVVAVVAALRSRRIDATRAALATAGLVSFSYWFAHGSIDWFWEIPALAAPALAVLGLAGGLSPGEPMRAGRARRPPRAILVLAAAGLVAASISYALPWLAAREVDAAVRDWRKDPAVALDRLEQARRLNVLSSEPDVVAGVLARRLGERERAGEAFRRALRRSPTDWYAHVELAVLDLEAGRRTAALLHLEHARRLNPLEPSTRALLTLALRNEPVPASLVERLDRLAVPSPLGRRPVDCRPVLGPSAGCAEREERP
jgi:O-antigen ligase